MPSVHDSSIEPQSLSVTGQVSFGAELDLATRNRELANDRAELSRPLFEAGRATADSVSDAEADAVKSQLQELTARQDASVSAYHLLDTLGTLVPTPQELLRNE